MSILGWMVLSSFVFKGDAKAFEFLQTNEQYAAVNEAVIVIGNHRSVGKDVLVSILASNNSELKSILMEKRHFLIIDKNGVIIGNTQENLLYPVLTVDDVTAIHFYNVPKFDTTRKPLQDFLADFYLTKMFNSLYSVKFVFAIDWTFLMPGQSRTEYLDLVRGVSKLLPNLDSFNSTIFLGVTKSNPVFIKEDILEGVLRFLVSMDQFLTKEVEATTSANNRNEILRYKKITHIFQNQPIGILREPNEDGPLSIIQAVQFDRSSIYKILENTPFSRLIPGDIGSVLTDNSVKNAQEVLRWTKSMQDKTVTLLIDAADLELSKSLIKVKNFKKKLQLLVKSQTKLVNVRPLIISANGTMDFIRFLRKALIEIGIYLPRKLVKFAGLNHEFQLHVETRLQKASGKSDRAFELDDRTASNYLSYFEELQSKVDHQIVWYNFAIKLHRYMFSGNLIIKLDEYGSRKMEPLKNYTFPAFLHKLTKWNEDFKTFKSLLSVELNQQQISEINLILISVFEEENIVPTVDLDNNCIFTTAKFVKNSLITNRCAGKDSVYFFSDDTITLGENIRLLANLYIIAPTVVVLKKVSVYSDGEVGQFVNTHFRASTRDISCPKEDEWSDPKNKRKGRLWFECKVGGEAKFEDVANGKNGRDVIIITQLMQNFRNLFITATGGNGAAGQDGENKEMWDRATDKETHFITDKYTTRITAGYGGHGIQGGWGGSSGHVYLFGGNWLANILQTAGINGLGGFGGRGGWPSGTHGPKNFGSCSGGSGTVWYYDDIIDDLCEGIPRCFCTHKTQKEISCYNREDIFNIASAKKQRAYQATEGSHTSAECCEPSSNDGTDFTGTRTGNPPELAQSTISSFVNLYKKSIIPRITPEFTATSDFLSFLSSSLEDASDTVALVKEMSMLSTFVIEKTVPTDLLISLFEKLIKDIVRHVQHPGHKALTTTCGRKRCKEEDGNFNGNCNSVFKPSQGFTVRGTGPICTTNFTALSYGISYNTTKVLGVVVSSGIAQIKLLKKEGHNNLVSDIKKFLQAAKDSFIDFRSMEVLHQITIEINTRMNVSFNLLDKELKPTLKSIHDEIDIALNNAVKFLKEQRDEANAKINKTKEQEGPLLAAIGLKTIASGMDIIAGFAVFMGPPGAAASTAISGISVMSKWGVGSFDPTQSIESRRKAAQTAAEPMRLYLKNLASKYYPAFESQLKDLEEELKKLPPFYANKRTEILNDITKYKSLKNAAVPDNHKLAQLLTKITTTISKLRSGSQRSSDTDKTVSKIENIGNAINLIKIFGEAGTEISKTLSDVTLVDETIKELRALVALYDRMIETVSNFLTPMVNEIFDNNSKWLDGSSPASSLVELDFESFKLGEKLYEMKAQFLGFEAALGQTFGLPALVDKLERAMGMVFSAHKHNLENEEKRTELKFMAQIGGIDTACKLAEPTLLEPCQHNEMLVSQANYLWKFKQATKAFILNKFPLASSYEQFFEFNNFFGNKSSNANTTLNSKISQLITELNAEEATVSFADQYDKATQTRCPTGNIYEWSSDDYRKEINDILSGKKVTLVSSVFKSQMREQHAVKFKTVHLEFIPRGNSALLESITNILNEFMVTMKHSGISYYIAGNKYYALEHDSVSLWFNATQQRYSDDHRFNSSNIAYQKLASGDYALSPFTSWDISLEPVVTDHNNGFSDFVKFLNETVDLRLCGQVWFLRNFDEDISSFYWNGEDLPLAREAIDDGN